MFGLIAWAIGGIALIAGIAGFDHWRQGVGREKEVARVQPVMSICEQFPSKGLFGGAKAANPAECGKSLRDALALGQQAEAANKSLQADLATLDAQRKACSGAVVRLQKQGEAAAAAAATRKPSDDKALATINAEKTALIAALSNADSKAGTCEQRLARRDALWAGVAAQRQRDFPPGPPAQSGDVNIRSLK